MTEIAIHRPSASKFRIPPWRAFLGNFGLCILFLALLLVNLIQIASLTVRPFSGGLFRRINRGCANQWWSSCVFWLERIVGIRFEFSGDAIPSGENAIVICNHQEMSDILSLMALAIRKDRLGDMKWYVKDVVKYVPGIGWGMLFLDCIFLKRNWDRDQSTIDGTFRRLLGHRVPFWLISFSEGTRITPKKLKKAQAYARNAGLPVLENVLVPRTKGFVASVQGLRSSVDAVYDVTLGYEGGVWNLWHFVRGKSPVVHMHVKRYPLKTMPESPQGLTQWMIDRFVEKDRRMAEFHRCGSF